LLQISTEVFGRRPLNRPYYVAFVQATTRPATLCLYSVFDSAFITESFLHNLRIMT